MTVNCSKIRALVLVFFLAVNSSLFAASGDAASSTNGTNSTADMQNQGSDKNDASAAGWGFVKILLVLGCFGAFGGGLAAFSQVTFSEVIKNGIKAYGSGKTLAGIVTVGALLGCGGSIVFGFILAVDRKFTSGVFDLDTKVLIAAASVAAGFSGIRMLKLVSDELAKKVETQGKDIDKQKQAIQQQQEELQRQKADFEEKVKQDLKVAEALSFSGGVLASDENDRSQDGYRHDAITLLQKASGLLPFSRTIGVYLGRLHRQLGDYPSAIRALPSIPCGRR